MQKLVIEFVLKPLIGAVVGTVASAGVDAAITAIRNRKQEPVQKEPERVVAC